MAELIKELRELNSYYVWQDDDNVLHTTVKNEVPLVHLYDGKDVFVWVEEKLARNILTIYLKKPFRFTSKLDFENNKIYYYSEKTTCLYCIEFKVQMEKHAKYGTITLTGLYFMGKDFDHNQGTRLQFQQAISVKSFVYDKINVLTSREDLIAISQDLMDIRKILGFKPDVYKDFFNFDYSVTVNEVIDFTDLTLPKVAKLQNFINVAFVKRIIAPKVDLETVIEMKDIFGTGSVEVLDLRNFYNDIYTKKNYNYNIRLKLDYNQLADLKYIIIHKECKNFIKEFQESNGGDLIIVDEDDDFDNLCAKAILVGKKRPYIFGV